MISPAQEVKVGEVFLLMGGDGINLSVHAYILFHELGMLRDKLKTDYDHHSHSCHLPTLLFVQILWSGTRIKGFGYASPIIA